jgi:uncharacterized protein (UPF0147 family)
MDEPSQAKPKRSGSKEARDVVLITALASGATQANAGRAAGMSDRTIRRRLADPDFATRVAAESRQVASRAAARISALAGGVAVTVLEELLADPSTPPHIRLRAALGTLHMLPAVRDHAELEEMVTTIEAQLPRLEELR